MAPTELYKTDRYKIVFETINKVLRVIDNTKKEPLIRQEIDGTMTISEFCGCVESIKNQLAI
jgi:hypothetical protein